MNEDTANLIKVMTFDPPGGHRYGFPAIIPKSLMESTDDNAFDGWLLSKGYPEEDLEFGSKYGRAWADKVEESKLPNDYSKSADHFLSFNK